MIAPWFSGKSVRGRRGSRQIVWLIAAMLIACAPNSGSVAFGQQPVSPGGSSPAPTVSGFSFGTRTSDGLSIFLAPTTTMPDGSLAILPVNSEDPNFPMGEGNYLPSPSPLTLQIPDPGNYSVVAMVPDTNGVLNYFELYTDGSNTVYSTAYTLDDSGNQIVLAQATLTPGTAAFGPAIAGATMLAAADKATKTYPDGTTVSVTVTISTSAGPPPTVTETLTYVFTSATGVVETWTIVYTLFPNNWTGEVTVNPPDGGPKMLLLIGFYDGRPTKIYVAQPQ